MKLIVGLGNPGPEYANTRHNVGFMVIDHLLNKENKKLNTLKHQGAYCKCNINGEDVILLKPLTYMNLSGQSVRAVIDYYKINIEDILVIYDDMDTPPGMIRLRYEGSSGGHNGLKSIIAHLNTEKFKRIRIGIGKNPLIPTVNYVLGKINEDVAIVEAANAAQEFLVMDFEKLMSKYNKKKSDVEK